MNDHEATFHLIRRIHNLFRYNLLTTKNVSFNFSEHLRVFYYSDETTMTKATWWGNSLYDFIWVSCHFHSGKISTKNSKRAGTWRKDLVQGPWRGTDYWLPVHGLLIHISSRTQGHLPQGDTQSLIKKINGSLMRYFLNWVSHLLVEDSLCQTNIKVPQAQWVQN